MLTLKEQREAKSKQASDIVATAKAAARDLTTDEVKTVNTIITELEELNGKIRDAEASKDAISRFGAVQPENPDKPANQAKSVGEHFVKSVGEGNLSRLKTRGISLDAPEYEKAATDTMLVSDDFGPILTDVDRTIVRSYRRPTVSSLLGVGRISGTGVTYYVEGPAEGDFKTVAEGAPKPQLHIVNPTSVTDRVKKIAGWFNTSDEMIEDVPFFVSEINNRGLYMLGLQEEFQLLNGDGTGDNLLGMLNRSGVQTLTQGSDTAANAIFRATTAVQTATGLTPDGIIINPVDYQELRLGKDSSGQYYGGGYFAGQYGVDGMPLQPPVWGYPTVVSPAVAAGTVIVGALKVATTVYRKGGIRVESTNSHGENFTSNIVTTRIEERIGLAVRVLMGIVKLTLGASA